MKFPHLKVELDPQANSVDMSGIVKARGSLKVLGSHNDIVFGNNVSINCQIRIQGDHNRLYIGNDCHLRGQILIKGKSQTVSIGESTTFQSVYLLCQEGCDIIIGHHCMFSREIEVRTTDAHSLVDLATGERINQAKTVNIGDHVWIGLRALINKGASIPSDCIVGASAFVNGVHSESHTVLAGVPAKVVRRNVTWHRGRQRSFTAQALQEWQE